MNLNHPIEEKDGVLHDVPAVDGLPHKSAPILNSDGEPVWKILVFDNLGRDVISSVLRVSDLRTWGVTVHLYVYNKAT